MKPVPMPSMPRMRAKRGRFMPPWVVALCGMVLLAGIASLFPKASMLQQLVTGGKEERADSVKVLLLQTLIEKGVKGFALRREYIRQLALTGNFAESFEELDSLAEGWKGENRDSLWLLQIEVATWGASQAKFAAETGYRLRAAGEAMLREGGSRHLPLVARHLQNAGEKDLAARIYLRLAEKDSVPWPWQKAAAELYAAAGDCRKASQVWLEASSRLGERTKRKETWMLALRALQACDAADEALRMAEAGIGEWRDETDVLLFLVQLARSADKPKIAERYAQMMVRPLAAGPEP